MTAIVVIGSPAHQRALRFDERRVSDLRGIDSRVEAYARLEHRLPKTLDELERATHDAAAIPVDPESRRAYDYRPTDARHYELCAVFATARTQDSEPTYAYETAWMHPAGRYCFRQVLSREDDAKDAADAAADAAAALAPVN
ncbi:hypothetical protein [Lysobacter sp. TY2-98]|uniref:hypothetical protein n=1 Tax=Lysobacter sp. TY2-98 TaxID=2290922 RepID=UPI0013B3FCCC|nr:hypothetical protein [Lysobacter sp. TY2-98]